MNSSASGRGREWIGTKAAAERLGCPAQAVNRLARAGYLSLRTLPGCDPLDLARDVERLAQESTRYATGAVTSVAVGG